MNNEILNRILQSLEKNTYAIIETCPHNNCGIEPKIERAVIDDVYYDDINDCFDFYLRGDTIKIAKRADVKNCMPLSIDALHTRLKQLNIGIVDTKNGVELSMADDKEEFAERLLSVAGMKRIL